MLTLEELTQKFEPLKDSHVSLRKDILDDQTEDGGNTLLMRFVNKGDFESCCYLIKQGAGVNLQNDLGTCALMEACENGFKDLVKLLIDNGADVNFRNNFGSTALMHDCWSMRTDGATTRILLDSGAIPHSVNHNNESALQECAMNGKYASADMIINTVPTTSTSKFELVNRLDNKGRSCLMCAAGYGHKNVLKLLIENGAVLELIDHRGYTALDISIRWQQVDCAAELVGKGALISAQSRLLADACKCGVMTAALERAERWQRRKAFVRFVNFYSKSKSTTKCYGLAGSDYDGDKEEGEEGDKKGDEEEEEGVKVYYTSSAMKVLLIPEVYRHITSFL